MQTQKSLTGLCPNPTKGGNRTRECNSLLAGLWASDSAMGLLAWWSGPQPHVNRPRTATASIKPDSTEPASLAQAPNSLPQSNCGKHNNMETRKDSDNCD